MTPPPADERIAVLESEVRNLGNDVTSLAAGMRADFQELRSALRRPSWAVSALVAAESSLVVGLAVAMLTR